LLVLLYFVQYQYPAADNNLIGEENAHFKRNNVVWDKNKFSFLFICLAKICRLNINIFFTRSQNASGGAFPGRRLRTSYTFVNNRIHAIYALYTTVFRRNTRGRITIVYDRDRTRRNTAKYWDRIRPYIIVFICENKMI